MIIHVSLPEHFVSYMSVYYIGVQLYKQIYKASLLTLARQEDFYENSNEECCYSFAIMMLYNTVVFLDVATTTNEITKSIGDHVLLQ